MEGYHGIDISHWNRITDHRAVSDQCDFIILKAGGHEKAMYKDKTFDKNYWTFNDLGVDLGCYYFVGSNFYGEDIGVNDALHFIDLIDGKLFTYPVILDIEQTLPARKLEATEATIAFCDTLEKYGYYAMIYASDISGFKEKLYINDLIRFDKWVARYGTEPKYVKDYGIWQCSSHGHINGIDGNVDMDISFRSYPKIIKRAGLNNL